MEVDVKSMTKTERTELRRIVRRRFKMLRDQLARRERELLVSLERQVEQEMEDAVLEIEEMLKPLIERQNELAGEYAKVYEKAEELNVKFTHSHALASEAALTGYWGRIVMASTHKEAHERLQEIKESAGWSKLNLNEMEWRLDETLAVGELESGASAEFLAALPSVDSLLPLPSGLEIVPEIEPII